MHFRTVPVGKKKKKGRQADVRVESVTTCKDYICSHDQCFYFPIWSYGPFLHPYEIRYGVESMHFQMLSFMAAPSTL
jgi:hypothetical protein